MTDFDSWVASRIGQTASAYVPKYKIFPLHGITADLKCTCGNAECKSPGKHPFIKNGFLGASYSIEEVARLFQYRSDLNLGIVTGEPSNLVVIDVDGRNGGHESILKLIADYGPIPPAPTVITGNGYHIMFQHPGFKIPSRALDKERYPGIDIKGDGGYIVGVPSRHVSGKYYEYIIDAPKKREQLPEKYQELFREKKQQINDPIDEKSVSGAIPQWSVDEVCRMLDALDPSMGYDDWIKVGMGIHDGGFPYEIWHSWSKKGKNYEPNCCAPHWRSFKTNGGISMGSLVQMAHAMGWKPQPEPRKETDLLDMSGLIQKAEAFAAPPPQEVERRMLPFDPEDVPGLIGQTVRWINQYAMHKQPELALLNTIAFAGAVFGRRYTTPTDTRTNVYTLGVARTGAGKDFSRKCIKNLANACGLDGRIGSDAIRSDSGMLRSLMNNASQVMMIDEFGLFLQAIGNDRAPHYIRSQIGILLKLYSSSNSVYNHGDYADPGATPIIIHAPNLCIFGTSTEEQYAKSLRRAAVESGELNRFVVLKGRGDKKYPPKDIPFYDVDKALAEKWSIFSPHFGSSLGDILDNANAAPELIRMEWGSCDDIQHAINCKQMDKMHVRGIEGHLWSRMYENTVKIAMIIAIGRDPQAPVFEKEDFDLAQIIVESSIEYLHSLLDSHVSETPQEESNNEIVNAIRIAGGQMNRRDMMRKFRKLKKKELDEVLSSLIEQEVIEAVKDDSMPGRPRIIYKILPKEDA